MTYRRTCERCGGTFFAPDRKLSVCSKCAKRLGVARPPHTPTHPPRSVSPGTQRPTGARPTNRPSRGPTAQNHPPPGEVLTDEVRQAIRQAYDPDGRHAGLSDSAANGRIACDLKVRRGWVAEVLASVRPPDPSSLPPSEPVCQEILRRYQAYVACNERPPGGRHRTIARELGLCQRQVSAVLRAWRQEESGRLSRQQRFDIERAFWEAAGEGLRWRELLRRVADSTSQSLWSVTLWLDQLLEDPKAAAPADSLSPEARDEVEAFYRRYLQADHPPEASLHELLAERLGVAPKQVFAALVACRLRYRPAGTGIADEPSRP